MRTPKSISERLETTSRWLITGVAGFIGSHLLQFLLKHNQSVIGMDNFATGSMNNLHEVERCVSPKQWGLFDFKKADIRELSECQKCCEGVDFVLHQAALGSVPRSIQNPNATNQTNIEGHLNILVASRDQKVRRVVYAASSSTYGDHTSLPKQEDIIGRPLSPYAVTKLVNELYAEVFARTYSTEAIGLRYFNVFGPRQAPHGPYAAVIPLWIHALSHELPAYINGDGETSRDFCYIANVIQANLLAATCDLVKSRHEVYNIAAGEQTSLNSLYELIRMGLARHFPNKQPSPPIYRGFRQGDVRHSLASINKARLDLGYTPTHTVRQGISETIEWYTKQMPASSTNNQ